MSSAQEKAEQRAAAALTRRWPGTRVDAFFPLAGHSGLTLRADLSGDAAPSRVAVKLCPPGRAPVGRHDVVRQARIVRDLAGRAGVAVPEVLLIDMDEPPVTVFSWAEGEGAEPVLELAPGERPAEVLCARYRHAAHMLAALHAVPVSELSAAGGERRWAPVDELERWRPTMETVDPELRPGADELYKALAAEPPPAGPNVIVHGDYRLGNLLCQGEDVRAIVDWEIWSVGDARVDLGWFLIMSAPDDLPGVATSRDEVLPAAEVLGEYERAAGAPVSDMVWFDALARYKMAAIMGNNLRRHRAGRRVDPYQERLVEAIPTLIRRGLELTAG